MREAKKLKAKMAARARKKKVAKKKKQVKEKSVTNKKHYKKKKKQKAKELREETAKQRHAREEWERAQQKMKAEDKARQELARREMARRHLLPFIQRDDPNYLAGWFHKDLCMRLEKFLDDVVNKREPRLMLFVPPRHGKSMTGSQYFPAWALGKYPWLEFMNTSYAESLQLKMARAAQQIVRGRTFKQVFPNIIIPRKNEAISDWRVAEVDESGVEKLSGGGMLSAGVGGPLTGRGFHVGIIDDPIKNREEADSQTTREAIKSWYSSTFYTRAQPGAGILCIQTRWHDDDLSGWLLQRMAEAIKEESETGIWPEDADRWEVIEYPAIAIEDEKYRKRGEALHPERFSLLSLLKKKRTLAPRDWAALYQQNPVAEEGSFFTKDMIRFYSAQHRPALDDLNIFAAGDLAISKKEDADYTVFLVVGLDKEDNIWVLDARRGRWDTDEITDQVLDIYKTWKPLRFGIEKEKVAMAIGSDLDRKIREEKAWGLMIEDLHIANRDKRTRARPIQGRMKQGAVLWPRSAMWVDGAVNELLRFDAGVHDDYVDAIAWVGQMLAEERFSDPMGSHKKKKKSWKSRLRGYVKGNKSNSSMAA